MTAGCRPSHPCGSCDDCLGAPLEPATGAELLDEVERYIGRFCAFPTTGHRVAVTLWAVHAHAVDVFESSPRLALLSPEPGSGKTRVLEVLEPLVPGAMHVLSASTPALFRTIEDQTTTLLLDEVDAIFGRRGRDENNEDLRALLNAGHRKGAQIPRCVGPTHAVRRFPVYAAAALAGLGDLPDTLMSRSVVIRMRRRAPGERVEPFRLRDHVPEGEELRDLVAAWADEHRGRLGAARPVMPEGIEDRRADVWEALLAVADAAGGDWPTRARAACTALADASVSREASLGVRLLTDLRRIFGDADKLSTATILERLVDLKESPWSNLRGEPLDARGLSWRLRQYEVSSTKVNIDGSSLRGYKRQDLWDAWERYAVDEDDEDEDDEDGDGDTSGDTESPEPTEPPRSRAPNPVPDAGEVPEPATQPEPVETSLTLDVPEVPEVPDLRTTGQPEWVRDPVDLEDDVA